MIRFTMMMPEAGIARLEALALADQRSKSAIVEKALILYELAHNAASDGKSLAIVDSNGETETRIVGL